MAINWPHELRVLQLLKRAHNLLGVCFSLSTLQGTFAHTHDGSKQGRFLVGSEPWMHESSRVYLDIVQML